MCFLITPHNILNCNSRALIFTDEYSDDEIKDGRHIRDIKADFPLTNTEKVSVK